MTQPETLDVQARMNTVMLAVKFLLLLDPVDDLLANIDHAHAVMPFLDPTAYQRGLGNLDWQTQVLRAVQRFQRDLESIREMLDVETAS